MAATDARARASTPEASEGTRIVVHAMGETEVPAAPLRVVALDGPMLDACLLLGVKPIGATTGVANDPWPAYLADRTEGIVNVGEIVAPDLELIVSLNPDLILGVKSRHEEIYAELAGIAPVVFVEEHRTRWRENFLVVADALNQNAQVEIVVGAFDQRCAEIGERLAAEQPGTVSVLRVYTDVIYAYQAGSFSGSVLAAIGLERPESQSDPDQLAVELSAEQLVDADAELMFLTVWGNEANTDVATVVSNPLWPTLEAVKAGRVYLVPDEYWMVAMGYIAAHLILNDVTAYLLDGAAPVELPGT
jgi:iron complex transport system substrate-binding protein